MIRAVFKKSVMGLVPLTNPMVRWQLETALQKSSYEVLWTQSFPQAVELCRRRTVQAVVLDLPRPLSMCWELFAQLRAVAPKVPMILLTERAVPFELKVASVVGVLMAKPFRIPELIQALGVLLSQEPGKARPATRSLNPPAWNMNILIGSKAPQPRPAAAFGAARNERT